MEGRVVLVVCAILLCLCGAPAVDARTTHSGRSRLRSRLTRVLESVARDRQAKRRGNACQLVEEVLSGISVDDSGSPQAKEDQQGAKSWTAYGRDLAVQACDARARISGDTELARASAEQIKSMGRSCAGAPSEFTQQIAVDFLQLAHRVLQPCARRQNKRGPLSLSDEEHDTTARALDQAGFKLPSDAPDSTYSDDADAVDP